MKINLKIPVTIFKEKKSFIAYTPVLDLSTSALTFEKVKARFAEIIQVFFDELERMGTTEQVLTDLGWKKLNKEWTPLAPVAHEIQEIQISV